MKYIREDKKYLHYFIYIPVIIMIVIILTAYYIFEQDKIQTYERVKQLKEQQVQMLTVQMDYIAVKQNKDLDTNDVEVMSVAVDEMNKMQGVYCYLYDNSYNSISNYTGNEKAMSIYENIEKKIKSKDYKRLDTEKSKGWIEVKSDVTGEVFIVYWQGIPTETKHGESDYFIYLAMSKDSVTGNKAIHCCEIFIAILTITLTISLYDSIYGHLGYYIEADKERQKRRVDSE